MAADMQGEGDEGLAKRVFCGIMLGQDAYVIADSLRGTGIQVHAADVINDFVGHGGCDSVEWLHKIRIGANGEGDFHLGDEPSPFCFGFTTDECLSRESFHPNADGAAAYAVVLRRKLDEIGYT